MAQNQAFDAVAALTPRLILRLNDNAANTVVANSSYTGATDNFTCSVNTSTLSAAGAFTKYNAKNDDATNTAFLLGTAHAQKAALTNTVENIPTTGITVNMWIKADTSGGTYTTPFDCRSAATGKNGLALMYDTDHTLAGNPNKCTVFVNDTGSGVSYFEWADAGASAWWRDGLWHMVTIQVLAGAIVVFLDGVAQGLDANNTNSVGATGSFAAPIGTQFFNIGQYLDGSQDANGTTVQLFSWHNSILTAAQVLALYHAGSYLIGNATSGYAALGVNGGFHGDASDVSSITTAKDGANDRYWVTAWSSQHDATVIAANAAADSTCPTYPTLAPTGPQDPLGRKSLGFDGVLQAALGYRPFLNITAPFAGTAQRITFAACAQVTASLINGIADMKLLTFSRASAGANIAGLSIASDSPAFRINNSNRIPTSTAQPSMCAIPSAGVFGSTSGAGGTSDDMVCFCRGDNRLANGTIAAGNYSNPLDGDVVIGCTDTSATPSTHFSGLLHEAVLASRPWTAQERANFTAYCNTKWLSNTQTVHAQIWGTSIDVGTPSSGNHTDNNLWEEHLSAAVVRTALFVNASQGGAQSGPIFSSWDGAPAQTGTGPMDGNGDDLSAISTGRNAGLLRWSAHTGNETTDLAIWTGFTNDCAHAQSQSFGDVSLQSINNYSVWKALILAARPACKVLVILPPAVVLGINPPATTVPSFSGDGFTSYNSIVAYFAAHPTAADKIVTITGVSVWIHPTKADYSIIAAQIDAALQQMLGLGGTNSDLASKLLLLLA